ncbi:hypothetical protein SARC_04203 [Sphaeroforma arctica JP610]|uniref:Uncharacterized protein n=1 Tax=Sphaeroforma arctica JP610 TaxID=667725 RepID=A0A0L0G3Z7_9EUKA|nr:hypothetical protein SARC_04203 [Sphaeroforma arctica JP610]KNC83556.1 hypothetical protein SARC_04203 [Sphaeroforma arctica JP610]|eukprot:XP_014157458.1 hypothetical protein SARC_04203 [Sphaeroforma arctica JP610]
MSTSLSSLGSWRIQNFERLPNTIDPVHEVDRSLDPGAFVVSNMDALDYLYVPNSYLSGFGLDRSGRSSSSSKNEYKITCAEKRKRNPDALEGRIPEDKECCQWSGKCGEFNKCTQSYCEISNSYNRPDDSDRHDGLDSSGHSGNSDNSGMPGMSGMSDSSDCSDSSARE